MSGLPSSRARGLHVLFLTQYYPPEVGAAPTRAVHFARALVRAGHRVTVVTGLPNHPSGEFQRGFRVGVSQPEDGITVRRSWLYASPKKSTFSRFWNYLSFSLSSAGPAFRSGKVDLVLVTVPPTFVGTTASLAAIRHRAPLIVDVRDDWPRAPLELGEMRRGPLSFILDQQVGFLYQCATRLITVTKGMGRSLSARGIEAGRQVLITNGADTDQFHPSDGRAGESDPPFTVLYAGTHGLIHGMGVLLDAAALLKERGGEGEAEKIRFLLVGDGVAKAGLMASAQARGLDLVEFLPSQPPEVLAETMASADVCVATQRDHPFSGETIPVKLFDYMAAGKPVVGSLCGDAEEVLAASGGGIVTAPESGPEMADAITSLAADPGRRAAMGVAGAAFVEQNYSRRALGEKLVSTAEEVVRLDRGRKITSAPGGLEGVFKRLFDIAASATLLVQLGPLLLLVAILIRLDSPGPALFRQRRPGRGSREFMMLKFRTMNTGVPDLATDLVAPDSSYVTRIGKILRRTSLDELPQLINILKGQMSFVGPRPALFNQDDLIAMRKERGIDALRPGLTGWAQIHGRDEIPLDEKVELDHHYLKDASFNLDVKILLRTFTAVFSSRGAR